MLRFAHNWNIAIPEQWTRRDLCTTPLNGHYEPVWSVWFVWLIWFVWSVWLVWSVCRAKFTPLNRVPFGKFNGGSGQHQWTNHKLFEAVRPCFCGI
ncbi:MAG: hypothetical protein DRH10_01345 [Deltaproteobacteria bacterium]|nr:MAG: hypothetical protein DRH10_01345 [Deltaproteobacteria bacterium]